MLRFLMNGKAVTIAVMLVSVCLSYYNSAKTKEWKRIADDAIEVAENWEAVATEAVSVAEVQKKLAIDAENAKARYLQQRRQAEDEIENLNYQLDSATKRLSIRATCKADSSGVSGASSSSGVNAGNAELDGNAERAYLRHRRAIAEYEARYKLCVATLKNWSEARR